MTSSDTPKPPFPPLAQVAVIFGILLTTIALLADELGFGRAGSFGSGQLILTLLGAGIILAGFFGRRLIQAYRALAIIFLNTILLLITLELASIALFRAGIVQTNPQQSQADSKMSPYYQDMEWADSFWEEVLQAESYSYKPYIIWRHDPFDGNTVNIMGNGIRSTPGADCRAGALRVYTFGGSTMWGWGSPDWETIPAHLQDLISARLDRPVCTINFGEDGYVSSQSLVLLILELRSSPPPDIVVFYDGVNDVQAAFESGTPSVPVTLDIIEARFEEQGHPLIEWLKSTRQFSLYQQFFHRLVADNPERLGQPDPTSTGGPANNLARNVVSTYLNNMEIVGALADDHGFAYYFFWQPHLGLDPKPLTPQEQDFKSTLDPNMLVLARDVYGQVSENASSQNRLWSLTDIFRQEGQQIWIDSWGHVTPVGNRLVAEAMVEVLDLPGQER